jgi:hypothetical protein
VHDRAVFKADGYDACEVRFAGGIWQGVALRHDATCGPGAGLSAPYTRIRTRSQAHAVILVGGAAAAS